MKAITVGLTIFISVFGLTASAETIVARQISGQFYADGKMETDSTSKFESTYEYIGDTITRVKVANINKKTSDKDNTEYTVIRGLMSDPGTNLGLSGKQVIRAIGRPGSDAVEILVITSEYIESIKSTADYVVIMRFKIIKRF